MSKITERNLPNVGAVIKAARNEKQISLAKLGSLAGLSASYLHRIENGERACVSSNLLKKILQVLDLDSAKVMQIQPANDETDLGLLLHIGQCTIFDRKLTTPEKAFLLTCINALGEDWDKKKKVMFVLELLENVERLKALKN